MHDNIGSPTQFHGDDHKTIHGPPATLCLGFSIKSAFSFKQNCDFWRSKAPKLKLVQPYDLFLSNPHISASGIINVALTAFVGDCSVRSQENSQESNGFSFQASGVKSAFLADLFASVSPGFMPAWISLLVQDLLQVLHK
ncbi:protein trigalactosyldiacylglycerol 4 [Quercus suber]|uniref:Protein trigalactosyldiacylglycerol 4 n=1 Tax=Quercus suber TaxID=58331 RepID=A0AAW0JEX7_QUESU